MWRLRSLAFHSDLFLAGICGQVIHRGRYTVVSTPDNPDFWWGNYLVYPEPPGEDDAERWLADHARELPHIRVRLFTWDRPDGARGAIDPFVTAGFELDESVILTATREELVKPRRWNPDVRVAPLASDADWAAAERAQTNAFAPRRSGTLDDIRRFVDRQHVLFRRMQGMGVGRWWGAWLGAELVGSLGLVRVPGTADNPEVVGRFQLVGVDPRSGGRGVCSTMVYEVARRALVDDGLPVLVMAADASYHAARVYEGVGFRPTERLAAVIDKPHQA